MLFKTANFLTSLLISAVVVAYPFAAEAGGMSRIGTYGNNFGTKAGAPGGPNCKGGNGGGGGHPGGYSPPTTINNNINVYKPTTINKNVNVYKPIDINKSVNITNNIDDSKNITINKPISITKNIDNSKYIDDSKNIEINKSIVINNGSGEAAALAIAAAAASASASASVNIYGSSSSFSNSMSGGVFNYSPEAPTVYTGGDLGNLSVEAVAPAAPTGMGYAPGQCTYQDATVVKSIHAVCVSDDGHEFPASHMTSETWINSAYEGELARCLPGSRLKVAMGKATPTGMGFASASGSDTLQCGVHEALRHYKDGVLKCAPAVPVPDCTERTNLRKYGTGDMFFTYRTKICAETSQEYVGQMSRAADAGRN